MARIARSRVRRDRVVPLADRREVMGRDRADPGRVPTYQRALELLNPKGREAIDLAETFELARDGIPPPSTAFQHRFISQSLMRLLVL
jgi:hypothetical protein